MFFEVTAGVGGQEAMLFAAEMIAMYEGFIEFNGWQKDVTEIDKSDIGALKINFARHYGLSKNH
jgi:peptide chain release factor 1